MSSNAERLREALASLAVSSSEQDAALLTVAALCRATGISRNSLYRYHPQILEALHTLRRQQRAASKPGEGSEVRQLRAELAQLRAQIPKLAALIDHYYAATTELRTLLERRDRELAELRRRLDSRPAQISR
jgi:chromosome segregation ATPase